MATIFERGVPGVERLHHLRRTGPSPVQIDASSHRSTRVDPNIKHPRVDECTSAFERAIGAAAALHGDGHLARQQELHQLDQPDGAMDAGHDHRTADRAAAHGLQMGEPDRVAERFRDHESGRSASTRTQRQRARHGRRVQEVSIDDAGAEQAAVEPVAGAGVVRAVQIDRHDRQHEQRRRVEPSVRNADARARQRERHDDQRSDARVQGARRLSDPDHRGGGERVLSRDQRPDVLAVPAASPASCSGSAPSSTWRRPLLLPLRRSPDAGGKRRSICGSRKCSRWIRTIASASTPTC